MNLWADAFDEANAIDSQQGEHLTIDQRLKLAEIKALLAIGQELIATTRGRQQRESITEVPTPAE